MTSYINVSDELPEGRDKHIMSHGYVAVVKFHKSSKDTEKYSQNVLNQQSDFNHTINRLNINPAHIFDAI